ncbi:hypothetical protein JCGZ_06176 [Jatropha curcas]|uniref:Disease resistance protein At4g27190-like leucine-rich repeats domain-containing protein n=1 Tax=Jatropha curcas TaxID=180498 RepID=A0A067KXX3_JATCU|nr:hypothetical protein JCGZ_06176 [Jatropha curcas]
MEQLHTLDIHHTDHLQELSVKLLKEKSFNSLRELKDNLEDLKNARNQLQASKNDLLQRVRNEEGPQMKRKEIVRQWLESAENKLAEVNQLIREAEQEIDKKLCLGCCCSNERLPVELKKLVNLKCFNLEKNDQLRIIPRQVISSLSSLQVLRMFRCGFSLQEEEDNILSATNMDINELQSLKSLKGSKSLNISHLAAMNYLLTLEIHQTEHLRVLNVNFMMDTSFTSLRDVNVGKCPNLRDLTWLIRAPNLAILRVSSCREMEEIISIGRLGEVRNAERDLFAKLEVLDLKSLHKLRSIYWKTLPFQLLKKIRVYDCPLLKKLPLSANSAKRIAIDSEDV